jgi:hypothetical protein
MGSGPRHIRSSGLAFLENSLAFSFERFAAVQRSDRREATVEKATVEKATVEKATVEKATVEVVHFQAARFAAARAVRDYYVDTAPAVSFMRCAPSLDRGRILRAGAEPSRRPDSVRLCHCHSHPCSVVGSSAPACVTLLRSQLRPDEVPDHSPGIVRFSVAGA